MGQTTSVVSVYNLLIGKDIPQNKNARTGSRGVPSFGRWEEAPCKKHVPNSSFLYFLSNRQKRRNPGNKRGPGLADGCVFYGKPSFGVLGIVCRGGYYVRATTLIWQGIGGHLSTDLHENLIRRATIVPKSTSPQSRILSLLLFPLRVLVSPRLISVPPDKPCLFFKHLETRRFPSDKGIFVWVHKKAEIRRFFYMFPGALGIIPSKVRQITCSKKNFIFPDLKANNNNKSTIIARNLLSSHRISRCPKSFGLLTLQLMRADWRRKTSAEENFNILPRSASHFYYFPRRRPRLVCMLCEDGRPFHCVIYVNIFKSSPSFICSTLSLTALDCSVYLSRKTKYNISQVILIIVRDNKRVNQ